MENYGWKVGGVAPLLDVLKGADYWVDVQFYEKSNPTVILQTRRFVVSSDATAERFSEQVRAFGQQILRARETRQALVNMIGVAQDF